ncbi:hypothetical protein [Nostoc sp.]|uniref:hypothetical protein n=2 Tax=Nostoc sp. TaxID=1180 RepID=UPI002FEE9A4C
MENPLEAYPIDIPFSSGSRASQGLETRLHNAQQKLMALTPQAERLLRAFSNLTLTIIEVRGERFGYVPPLNPLQQEIISLLGLSPNIYSSLVDNSS